MGMTLDYIVRGELRVTMIRYIEDIHADFEKAELKRAGKKISKATNNIFVVNEDCKKLNQNKVVEFHDLV